MEKNAPSPTTRRRGKPSPNRAWPRGDRPGEAQPRRADRRDYTVSGPLHLTLKSRTPKTRRRRSGTSCGAANLKAVFPSRQQEAGSRGGSARAASPLAGAAPPRQSPTVLALVRPLGSRPWPTRAQHHHPSIPSLPPRRLHLAWSSSSPGPEAGAQGSWTGGLTAVQHLSWSRSRREASTPQIRENRASWRTWEDEDGYRVEQRRYGGEGSNAQDPGAGKQDYWLRSRLGP